MLRIMSPCRAADEAQVKAKIKLLQEIVGSDYQIGLELVGPWNDFFNQHLIAAAERNLGKQLPGNAFLSLHAPFDVRDDWQRNFFSSNTGYDNLRYILILADLLKAKLVNLHASLFYTAKQLRRLQAAGIEEEKEKLLQKVRSTLAKVRQHSPFLPICLENVPYTWDYDNESDPEKMVYEICFTEVEHYLFAADPPACIFPTIDLCHLSANYDSSQLLAKLRKIQPHLRHFHFCDCSKKWFPFMPIVKEGVIPGDGIIGERVFREILSYLVKLSESRDINIVVEVWDDSFTELSQSRESLIRLMRWLKEIK